MCQDSPMTEDQVRNMVLRKLGSGTQTALAKEIGVSVQYLNDVLNGRRMVGPKILAYLKLKRDIVMADKPGPQRRRSA